MKDKPATGRKKREVLRQSTTHQVEVAPGEFLTVQISPEEPAEKARATGKSPLGDDSRKVPASFGPYLAALRRERGLTLRDAAAEIGLSHTYLQQIETGERLPRPSVSLMQRIAAAFGLQTAEVFAAAGIRAEAEADRRTLIDRAFRTLVLHPDLSPHGMKAKFWLDSFSTRQKLQWIEFAQFLYVWKEPAENRAKDEALLDVLAVFPVDEAMEGE